MSAAAERRRRRTLGAFGVGIASLILLPLLGWMAADTLRSSKEGRDALAGLAPLLSIPPTPTALIAALDDNDRVASLALVALSPPVDGQVTGGTVVVVPAGSDTYLPDGTRGRVGQAYDQGGLDGLVSTAEGLLGVSLDTAVALPAADLAGLFADLGEVEVDFARRVIVDTSAGDIEEVFGTGAATLDPQDIGDVLAAWSRTESEIDRLPRLDALWRSVQARVGTGLATGVGPIEIADGSVVPALPITEVMARLFGGPMQVHTFSGDPVTDPSSNPEGLDLIRLDTGEVIVVMATIAPSAVSPPNPTLSFYVQSSLGDPALTKDAVERLILAGANVVLVTENPGQSPPAATVIEYADDNDADESERFADQLGTFTSRLAEARIDGVDATVILGESYRNERSVVVASSSTTTPDTTESSTG